MTHEPLKHTVPTVIPYGLLKNVVKCGQSKVLVLENIKSPDTHPKSTKTMSVVETLWVSPVCTVGSDHTGHCVLDHQVQSGTRDCLFPS